MRYPLLALLLLTAVHSPTPAERARAVALKKLLRLLGAGFLPATLKVYSFPAAAANKYLLDEQAKQDFELVTYRCIENTSNPLSSTINMPRFAALVDRNDSLTFFVPDQHQREFERNYGVNHRQALH